MTWFDKKPIIVLAPMADMTDGPFCRICREVSGNNFVIFREMVSAEAIVRGNEKTLKMCEFDMGERLIILQLFGADPKRIQKAAEIIVTKYKPDGIDVNMGCPVPKIAGKADSGAALMKDHDRAIAIVKALKNANLGVPVSIKTRLGWSKDDEILEFAPKLEQAGADLISIHGRTKSQGYSGVANWEMIGKVKELVKIPVIANGNIVTREDMKHCLEVTRADGVMIGRGSLGNPWIFQQYPNIQISKYPQLQDIIDVVLQHAKLHEQYYGNLVTFRKHLAHYFKGISGMKALRQELMKISTLEELKNILKKIPLK
ncbi:MAG TPA: tRNA dihydrouridine synthase DusB [Candidatus Magasanikbacteria bacterium]|nr:tRNA dihydrouridine synthase DusB [Candidatus Magasanikbacteria bacterium]